VYLSPAGRTGACDRWDQLFREIIYKIYNFLSANQQQSNSRGSSSTALLQRELCKRVYIACAILMSATTLVALRAAVVELDAEE
jgi:hypothetical protein